MLKQLYYGSLQDHMRTSRREMNLSFALQQQQLMRMNIMRESQRMMLTQAETIVRLNQLRDEVIKALPPKNVKVVIPTSNAALEETLSRSKQTQVTMEEEPEGKRAPPTKVRSAPASLAGSPKQHNLMVEVDQVVKSGLSPRQVKAEAKAAKAASKPSSPVPSLASTVASSQDPSLLSTASNQPGSPKDDLDTKPHFGRERKLLREAVIRSGKRKDGMTKNAQNRAFKALNDATSIADLKAIESKLIDETPTFEASDLMASGLMRRRAKSSGAGLKRQRAKSGRFVKSKR